jgi:predicted ATPase
VERFGSSDAAAAGGGATTLVATLNAQCGTIVYEADCLAAVEQAASGAAALPAEGRGAVVAALRQIATRNPAVASRVREVAARAGLALEP